MESPLHSGAEVAVGGGGGSPEFAAGAPPLEAAEKIILRWDSTVSKEADRYLLAVDEIQRSMSSTSINADEELRSNFSSTIQIAMARLEDEFRNILFTHSSNAETDSLLLDPAGAASSSSLLSNSARSDTAADDYGEDGEVLRSEGGSSSFSRSSGISGYRGQCVRGEGKCVGGEEGNERL